MSNGSCCSCRGPAGAGARSIFLPWQLPSGLTCAEKHLAWGCQRCGLAFIGAVAILCEQCFHGARLITHFVAGEPSQNIRLPIQLLTRRHEHDRRKHTEFERPRHALLN